jgi:UDP-glucuronate 4-epimerase
MIQPVLITGVAGFIGSNLAHRLLSEDYPVVGLDNFDNYYPVSIKRQNISRLEKETHFRLIEGDIRDMVLLQKVFSDYRFGSILHLAARAGVRPSVEDPFLYQDVNIRGTINLLHACRYTGVERFVLASSSSVYGVTGASPSSEDVDVNQPVSPYAASKVSAELFCRTYNHLYHLPVTILRLFTVYGPYQRPEMAIHRFIRQVYHQEEVQVFGDGTSRRDYTYIEDVVDGFLAAIRYRGQSFQIFNIGSGRTISLRDLLKVIEKTLNRQVKIRYSDPVPGDVPATIADISRAKSILGYEPRFSLEEGITRFYSWYLENQGALA